MNEMKIIARNKRASFDYELLEKVEAGLVLKGTEVKSLRTGKVTLSEAYVMIDQDQEAWLCQLTIPHYEQGNQFNHEEQRRRKLLLHKKQIETLNRGLALKGLSAIPLAIYFKGGLCKVEIALGKGKRSFDKRQDKMKKDVDRKLQQGDWNV